MLLHIKGTLPTWTSRPLSLTSYIYIRHGCLRTDNISIHSLNIINIISTLKAKTHVSQTIVCSPEKQMLIIVFSHIMIMARFCRSLLSFGFYNVDTFTKAGRPVKMFVNRFIEKGLTLTWMDLIKFPFAIEWFATLCCLPAYFSSLVTNLIHVHCLVFFKVIVQ